MTRNAFKLGLLEFLIKWHNLCTWNFQGILLEFQRAQENLIWRKLYCWHPTDQKIFANTFPPTSVAFPLFSSFFLYFWNIFIGVSVRFSLSVMSNSLPPRGLQHTRLLCPSPTPGACSYSCPVSMWCHPTSSSSVVPFSSCFQSCPASGSFPMSQFFTSGGSRYWSFSFSISPCSEY